jgi:hypothetical protein
MLMGIRERIDVTRTGTLFRNNPNLKVSSGENVRGAEFNIMHSPFIICDKAYCVFKKLKTKIHFKFKSRGFILPKPEYSLSVYGAHRIH